MKKFIMALMLCLVSIVGAHASSTVYGYTTNCLVWNSYYNQWQPIKNGGGIKVALLESEIYINSSSPQHFILYNMSGEHLNASGHLQFTCSGVDQDGHYCDIRIVFRDDQNCEAPLQIYIYYSNISYVYNIVYSQNNGVGI